ncbi:MAG TPA: (d)CMP kinase [Candidatus Dependentiae bacterium]|nr:(d)CMP kinase [Candidatus Dependentiae bacterium]HRQ62627.1 (d)CMP kinase [Candidatus Dependentiae bacterium]
MIVTIDGPAASGKTTIGRMLAIRLGIYYLYSGFLYRGLAYVLTEHAGYTLDDLYNPRPEDIAEYLDTERLVYTFNGEQEHVFFDGQDITPHLKTNTIDRAASIMSTNQYVRLTINNLMHDIADEKDIVVDGRDVGSVVFPDADFKFYITAPADVRAQRWQRDQQKLGPQVTFAKALETITERDKRDTERLVSPLIVPNNAIVVDTAQLTPEQAVEQLLLHMQNY